MSISPAVRRAITHALHTLPSDVLPVISLAFGFVDGHPYSVRRIAHTLHLSERRVKQLLQSGLTTLKADPVLVQHFRLLQTQEILRH